MMNHRFHRKRLFCCPFFPCHLKMRFFWFFSSQKKRTSPTRKASFDDEPSLSSQKAFLLPVFPLPSQNALLLVLFFSEEKNVPPVFQEDEVIYFRKTMLRICR
ncbi:MAG: hypothetical protein E7331_01790 [Clostridiales bacterium]|nr:hypothetical protein [Clostridiales bacterium]